MNPQVRGLQVFGVSFVLVGAVGGLGGSPLSADTQRHRFLYRVIDRKTPVGKKVACAPHTSLNTMKNKDSFICCIIKKTHGNCSNIIVFPIHLYECICEVKDTYAPDRLQIYSSVLLQCCLPLEDVHYVYNVHLRALYLS